MRLLLIEEDETIGGPIFEFMNNAGHQIDWAKGDDAELSLQLGDYNLVLLALKTEDIDSLGMLRRYRHRGGAASIIALIERSAHELPLAALDAGADDYLLKPFEHSDFNARTRLLLRRVPQNAEHSIVADLKLDHTLRTAQIGGHTYALKPSEFRLLFALIFEPARVFTRTELAMRIYGRRMGVSVRAIDVHVHALRNKLGQNRIATVRGVGYRIGNVR